MKMYGKKIEGANEEFCVIPRGDNDRVVFTARAVLDMEDFNKLCPEPKPPSKKMAGGKTIQDVESPLYKKAIEMYNTQRMNYMVLKSLQATEGLEWETVDMSDSSTWGNYDKELRDSGFSEIEIYRITNTVMTANCLNETKLEEARKDFLLLRQEKEKDQLSQMGEPSSTQSGELVKG